MSWMKEWRGLLALVLLGVFFTPLVIADAWPQGAAITNSTAVSNGPDDGQQYSVKAGNVYGVSLNVTSQSLLWAGIIGNITGSIQLRGSSNKSLKTWGGTGNVRNQSPAALYTAVVFAYNSTSVPAWGSIGATNNLYSAANLDSSLGITTTLTDSASNTFTATSGGIVVGGQTIEAGIVTSVARLNHWGGVYTTTPTQMMNGTVYTTQVINDGTNFNLLFASAARPVQDNLFLYDNATQANFQMLVWSDNRGDTTATSYDLYVQLA